MSQVPEGIDWHELISDAVQMFTLLKRTGTALEPYKKEEPIKLVRAEIDAMTDMLDEKYGIKTSKEGAKE